MKEVVTLKKSTKEHSFITSGFFQSFLARETTGLREYLTAYDSRWRSINAGGMAMDAYV